MNGFLIKSDRTIAPGFPFIVRITPISGKIYDFQGIRHEKTKNYWVPVPHEVIEPP